MGEDLAGKDINSLIQPSGKESASRFANFKQWLRKFGRSSNNQSTSPQEVKTNTSVNPNPEQETIIEPQEMPGTQVQAIDNKQPEEQIEAPGAPTEGQIEQPKSQKVTAVASLLAGKLKDRPEAIPLEFENKGVSALIGTNETISKDFFEEVQRRDPDGYIVAVGVGNALSLTYCFSEGGMPKGIILADIDPKVIGFGKLLVDTLKKSNNLQEFITGFFHLSGEQLQARLSEIIAVEQNPILKKRLQAVIPDEWDKEYKSIPKPSRSFNTRDVDRRPERLTYGEGHNIDVLNAIVNKYPVLKELADDDNIAVAYTDFTNPAFIQSVRGLPEFQASRNIIYLSNIVDHITHRGTKPENATLMERLKAYEDAVKTPIFIDTLGSLNYYLRARNSLSVFKPLDFAYREFKNRQEKPVGLVFRDEVKSFENVDLSKLTEEELNQRYKELSEHPYYKERAAVFAEAYPNSLLEEQFIPDLARDLYQDRKFEQENAELVANRGLNYRDRNIMYHGEEFVLMAELYEGMVNKVWQTKQVNMWGKSLNEVMSAL